MTQAKVSHKRVELVPISKIRVINPRTRNRKGHQEIIKNIRRIGLKRPITVARKTDENGDVYYDLICGQGRIEAFQALQQQHIPAFVTEATAEDCCLLSLVENMARRNQRPIELVHEIGELRKRGLTDPQIAQMIGVTSTYINMLGKLLDEGEERLLKAVEGGSMSIETAIEITRVAESDVKALLEIANKAGYKGKKLVMLRRLFEHRMRDAKSARGKMAGASKPVTQIKPAELKRMLKQEVDRTSEMAKKADSVRDKINFAVQAIRGLLSHKEFRELLDDAAEIQMPEVLRQLVAEGAAA